MCRLIESLKCKDGKIFNLEYHNSRLNKSRREVFGADDSIDLAHEINIPQEAISGLFKCRVLYSEEIEEIEFVRHQYRKTETLKVVWDNEIDYHLKYSDRSRLNKLFEKRGECDDILIVKNGFVTDSFAANIVFFDGTKWWTPETPLLPGTQRARLLHQEKIFPSKIKPNELSQFQKAGLINAMQDLNEMPVIPIEQIFF